MDIFDSHCHLDDRSYDDDLEIVIARARNAGVRAMMVVGTDLRSARKAVALAEAHPGLWASVGLHPHDARHCDESIISALSALARHEKVRAWGETGLDFNRMFSPQDNQEHWFVRQLEAGDALGLPMIFHERDTQGRFLELLGRNWNPDRKGVIHCFSGNGHDLQGYLDLGLYIGITGIVTIKGRGKALRRLLPLIPRERLLIETDAPYLTPTPERNKHRRNEPAFVRTVLLKLADVLDEAPEPLADVLWQNTRTLFGIP